MEGMVVEFNQLKKLVNRLKRQCEHVDDDVKKQFTEMLEVGGACKNSFLPIRHTSADFTKKKCLVPESTEISWLHCSPIPRIFELLFYRGPKWQLRLK